MKKIKLEEKSSFRSKLFRYAKIGGVLFLVLLFLEIWMINRLSTYGEKINKIKQAQASLELENQVLENQIAQSASLLNIQEKANQLGFTQASRVEYIIGTSFARAY
ncbi:hypothetical protein HY389_01560 [Candidatus Daviesbacteria bacterium]|nr:hypothetical protein [Candidatus Daviesbacteria bacterium]